MDSNWEQVGESVDTIDNLIGAMKLPPPDELHLKALRVSLPDLREKLKNAYVHPGSAWKMVYSGYLPQPDREISRCRSCVEAVGPFLPQTGIRPDCSCGIVTAESRRESE